MFRRRDFFYLLPALALGGCGSGTENNSAQSRTTIGIAYALGGRGDRNYNDAAAKALPALQNGFNVLEHAPLAAEDYGRTLATLAAGPSRLIFCIGFIYDTFVNQLAARYPGKTFCVLDGMPTAPNSFGIQFRVREAAALAGVVAADKSTTKVLGFVGGSDIPPIAPFADGFTQGARRLDQSIRVQRRYIGSGAEAFTNAARGRDNALQLMAQGADVLFHAAGASGAGVISAAAEQHKLAVGVDVDQSGLAPPGTVITSVLKQLDVAIIRVAERLAAGTRMPTGILELGLSDGAVGIVAPTGLSAGAAELLANMRREYGAP